jgi:N6-adenosine-specific RNA methylase IME4
MTRAVELMAHWGFQHKTILTWVKPRWGLGSYFRNSTEHVLFGVRGELRTRSDSIATHFEAPLGDHSEKPEIFYEIVRKASYDPYGEAFQRTTRSDFLNLFEHKQDAAGADSRCAASTNDSVVWKEQAMTTTAKAPVELKVTR